MGKKLYVGNLSYGVSDSALEQLFSQFGTVQSAQVIQDRATGRSKGFGFVEMDNDAQAQAAIEGLHERELDGRRLTVNEARPREDRGGGGGGWRLRRWRWWWPRRSRWRRWWLRRRWRWRRLWWWRRPPLLTDGPPEWPSFEAHRLTNRRARESLRVHGGFSYRCPRAGHPFEWPTVAVDSSLLTKTEDLG